MFITELSLASFYPLKLVLRSLRSFFGHAFSKSISLD